MAEAIVTLTDAPDPQAQAVIAEGLRRFNAEQAGIDDSRPLAVVVRDPATGRALGGLTGRTSLGVLFIDLFFLPGHLRGAGLGSRVLQMAEAEGARRGCRAVMLYTISFQAPGFYERHGYRALGTVECDPPGTRRVVMTKALGL